jgi:hypothetical protein
MNCQWCNDPLDERWKYCAVCGHRAGLPRAECDCRQCQARAGQEIAMAKILEDVRRQRLALENLLRVVAQVINEEVTHHHVSFAAVLELGMAAGSVRTAFQLPVEPLTMIIFKRKEWTPNNAKLS